MSREVTGRLYKATDWCIRVDCWNRPCRTPEGEDARIPDGGGWWSFTRRIDAIAFAARKGIRLEET